MTRGAEGMETPPYRQRIDLPAAAAGGYQALARLDSLIRRDGLVDDRLRELVKLRTSQMNGCALHLERHSREARRLGEPEQRLHQLAGWRESPLFTASQRAALALTEAVTRLGPDGVPDDVYDDAERHFGPQQLGNLILTVAVTNALNRIAVTARLQPPAPEPDAPPRRPAR
ncbi:carboxymuconolactone decarboxylase family protein [Yinghuangia seranimata]|uniref:carboxymuconolactone decarboxylase family protein n=1 Tax=Yinghuangia seranimata TaxID=408067 RepID=UPI00248CBF6D|nr:carboxymuconolactone decarboxylase family protein [Yinghuangia seranimata]MDI2126605.1 carboxymuconolactone decarboxylase family protein [Yinghuangia seranimata]